MMVTMVLAIVCQLKDAQAGKFDFSFGFYDLSGKTSTGTFGIANVGLYRLSYRHTLLSKFDLGAGVSAIMSDGIGGDIGFGLEVGMYYFPITLASYTKMNDDSAEIV